MASAGSPWFDVSVVSHGKRRAGRCGSCRYWAEGAQGRPDYGNCQAIGEMDGFAELAAPLALANNGDGTVSSWLETRAEFGCVLWTPQS